MVAIAICAMISGADSWIAVKLCGKSKKEWPRDFLALTNGIPSHDTFGRVFAKLDAQQFERCFIDWVRGVSELTEGGIVSIDGSLQNTLAFIVVEYCCIISSEHMFHKISKPDTRSASADTQKVGAGRPH